MVGNTGSPADILLSGQQTAITLSAGSATLYDAMTGARIAILEQGDDHQANGHCQPIGDRAWVSPDSQLVVVKMRNSGPVRFWSTGNGELVSGFSPDHSDGAQIDGAFSPDSTTFAFTDDGWLYLVNPAIATLRCPPVELRAAYGV